MTLSRRLGLSLLFLLALVFIGTLWINVNNTRDFINLQLESHAQDTATSLGLSISPYVGDQSDLPIVETMMNAIFDRGYYRSIVLKDLEGNVLVEKHSGRKIKQAPDWFSKLFPLNPPSSVTEINNGWNIAGVMTIVSDPGIGYQQLWRNTKQSFWMITGVFVLALLLIWLLVKLITKPLISVVLQAKAISKRQFDTVTETPKIPELKVIVDAINSMSLQLAKMFSQITNQAERYKKFAYSDKLTEVGNRRAFELAFDQILSDEEQQPRGSIVLIRLTSLSHVNTQSGYATGDQYIKNVCKTIRQQTAKAGVENSLYRLNGADFVLIVEEDNSQSLSLVNDLVGAFLSIEKSEYSLGTAHIGVSNFYFGLDRPKVMEEADSALANASETEKKFQIASELDFSQGNTVWRKQLQNLIDANETEFVYQPIKSAKGELLYNEWLARFKNPENNDFLPMGQLIPASVRLDFSEKLDMLVVNQALKKIEMSEQCIGLNISRLSLASNTFREWMLTTLHQKGAHCSKLVLELPERALVNKLENLAEFIKQLKLLGVRICVEHFGAQLAAITHLRAISPDYLKIDGRFTKNIHVEIDNQLFVQSLVNIAHGLKIKVIAEMIESEDEANCLRNLYVDNFQGYFVGGPSPLLNQ